MFTYIYPSFSGFSANCWYRIRNEVGFDPISSSFAELDGQLKTYLVFDREVTGAQKTSLDNLMTFGNPGYPPDTNRKFNIGDLNEKLAKFNADAGVNFAIYYDQTVRSETGVFDQLCLYVSGNLTTNQKNRVKNTYAALITEV